MRDIEKEDLRVRDRIEYSSVGTYLESFSHIPRPSESRLVELGKRKKKSEKVINEIWASNLRLVIPIAKNYKHLAQDNGMSFMDIIVFGNDGLREASRRYDSSIGKFSRYASWWVRNRIRSGIHDYRRRGFTLGNGPSIRNKDEDNHIRKRIDLGQYLRLVYLDSEVVNELGEAISLHERIGAESFDPSYPPSMSLSSPSEILSREENYRMVERYLDQLSERERGVIEMRFGLNGYERKSLKQVGVVFKVTKERGCGTLIVSRITF